MAPMTDEQTINEMILIQVNQTPCRKTCPSATVCPTNPRLSWYWTQASAVTGQQVTDLWCAQVKVRRTSSKAPPSYVMAVPQSVVTPHSRLDCNCEGWLQLYCTMYIQVISWWDTSLSMTYVDTVNILIVIFFIYFLNFIQWDTYRQSAVI
jgi:hypothetical protein